MVQAVILGSGNVAHHLARAFTSHPGLQLVQRYARNINALDDVTIPVPITHDLSKLVVADVYILAVSDDAIAGLSAQLPFEGRLVVHTSGSMPLEALDLKNRGGVFYPLQTFSKAKAVDFSQIPICVEAATEPDYALLETAARALSEQTYRIDSAQRRTLHVAAVFASNFSNHMYKLAADLCANNHMPFDILKPLIQETAHKILSLPPRDAQTGPAIRHDQKTIAAHLELLQEPSQRAIYQLLTQSIQHG